MRKIILLFLCILFMNCGGGMGTNNLNGDANLPPGSSGSGGSGPSDGTPNSPTPSIFGKYNINNTQCAECPQDAFGQKSCGPRDKQHENLFNGPFEIQQSDSKIFGNGWVATDGSFFDYIIPYNVLVPYKSKPDVQTLYQLIQFTGISARCSGTNKYDPETFNLWCDFSKAKAGEDDRWDNKHYCIFSAEKINRTTPKPAPQDNSIPSVFGKYKINGSKCTATVSKYWYKTDPLTDPINSATQTQCEQKSITGFIDGYTFETIPSTLGANSGLGSNLKWGNTDTVALQILKFTTDPFWTMQYYLKAPEFPCATIGGLCTTNGEAVFNGNNSKDQNIFHIKYDGGTYLLSINSIPPPPNTDHSCLSNRDYSCACRVDCEFEAEKQ